MRPPVQAASSKTLDLVRNWAGRLELRQASIKPFVQKGSGIYREKSGSLTSHLNFNLNSFTVLVGPHRHNLKLRLCRRCRIRVIPFSWAYAANSARRKCVGIRHLFVVIKGKLVDMARHFGEGIYNLFPNRNKGFISTLTLHLLVYTPQWAQILQAG